MRVCMDCGTMFPMFLDNEAQIMEVFVPQKSCYNPTNHLINKIKNLELPLSQKADLQSRFVEVCYTWKKVKPIKRRNVLCFDFIINKILEEQQSNIRIPLTRTTRMMKEYEKLWKLILLADK